MSKKKNKKILWIWWAIIVFLLIVVVYGVPFILNALVPTYKLEKETIQISSSETIFIARDEVVYGAPYTGKLEYLSEEGDLEKKGSKIVNMTEIEEDEEMEGQESEYYDITKNLGTNMKVMDDLSSEKKGVVSYYVDGNEGIFNQESIYEFTEEQLDAIHGNPVDLVRNEAKKGEPIFKIVDNSSWAMVFWTDIENEELYKEGDRVTVDFGTDDVRVTVEQVKIEEDKLKVVLTTNRYCEGFAKDREVDVKIIIDEKQGLSVKKSSIAIVDGVEGVYVLNKLGEGVFKPIKIILDDGDMVLVEEDVFRNENMEDVETVLPYQEVMTNPPEQDEGEENVEN